MCGDCTGTLTTDYNPCSSCTHTDCVKHPSYRPPCYQPAPSPYQIFPYYPPYYTGDPIVYRWENICNNSGIYF